jgi:hypothetical protein
MLGVWNPTEYIGFLSEIIKIPTKKSPVSGFFNHSDLKLVLYANHVKKNARGSLKQNCQPPQYLIFDDSKHCV